jgi:hypothetical protein
MPIFPEGSLLTFADSVTSQTAVTAVNDLHFRTAKQSFKRLEFDHARLREAPNPDGSMPIISQLIGGVPIIHFDTCNEDERARDLDPNDNVYDDIYKRFDIRQYEIIGANSLASETNKLFAIAKNHSVLIARFDAFITAASAYVSVDFLTAMQAEDLSYMTTTGLTMSGPALESFSPETNMLISEFVPNVTREIPLDASGSTSMVMRAWTMTIRQYTLVPDRSVVY